ncbi:hypothetical protein MPLA_570050 [Mesorhizobium sp. ORS 3359]|nr:hypothetical protein MPLA_570050 [Mesorhizobium sp. ORS 3359]
MAPRSIVRIAPAAASLTVEPLAATVCCEVTSASLIKAIVAGGLQLLRRRTTLDAGAAPHPPAGILSPYSDGERGAVAADFANHQRRKKRAEAAASPFSPSLYGEKCPAGR